MPKQHRWALKRSMDRANEDIERAQAHVTDVYVEFQDTHPELAVYLYEIGQALEAVHASIYVFRDEVI